MQRLRRCRAIAVKLHILAVGQRMPDWIETGWNEYAKRMPADFPLILREIKPEPRSGGKTPAQMMEAEARRIEAALPPQCTLVILDEHGRDYTTMKLSQAMQEWRQEGRDVAFIIGGPDGLDASLKQRGHLALRLSSLTLPHPFVRVMLAEQLYRAWTILQNHPYHRS